MQLKYLSLPICLLVCSFGTKAQNIPNTQTSNPATFTNMQLPDEVSPTGVAYWVTSYVPLVPSTDATSINANSPASNVRQKIVYYDGFKKPFQSIDRNAANVNNVAKNVIQIYDTRSIPDHYSFLPFSSNSATQDFNAFHDQQTYYNTAFPNEGYSSFSRSTSLTNVTGSGTHHRGSVAYSPGKASVGIKVGNISEPITNGSNEVIIWDLDGSGSPINTGYYAAGMLTGQEDDLPDANHQIIVDQYAPSTKTYSDRDGRLILKMVADGTYNSITGDILTVKTSYQCTYYVYDERGRLRWTITPKAFSSYQANNNAFSTANLNNLCFQYQYDAKGRLDGIRKPGEGGFTYVVYDRKDRPVMRQTPNEKLNNEWEVEFLDGLGRLKVSSIYTDPSGIDHNSWQANIDTWTTGGSYADLLNYLTNPSLESQYPVGDNPVSDVTNNAFSLVTTGNNKVMTINYYDDCAKLDPNGTNFIECSNNVGLPLMTTAGNETPTQSFRNIGKPVGSIVRILRSPNALTSTKVGDWRTSYVLYDDKGRQIFSKSSVTDNVNNNNIPINTDITGTQYDFADRVLLKGHLFINNNSVSNALPHEHTEFTKNQYDAISGALIKSVHQIDGGSTTPWTTIGSYLYDDLGRLKRKTLGDGGEIQEMTYNIRWQLAGINGAYAETGAKGGFSKSFGESLKYDYGFATPRYDSKISGMIWRGSSATNEYAYGYDYNQDGSLKTADFNHSESAGWSHASIDYSVSNLLYDKNGNLSNMKQRGTVPGTGAGTGPVDMDNLAYHYEDGEISNHLATVTEQSTTPYFGAGDFQQSASDSYDPNGNLKTNMGFKGISNITYTRFNKPELITYSNGSTVEYSYDAAGNKVEELVTDFASSKRKRTDYIGNTVYQNTYSTTAGNGTNTDSLQYVVTAEGRTTFDFATKKPKEEYMVKDHLGNVRSVINVSGYDLHQYLATYEFASAHLEDLVWDNLDNVRDIKPGGAGDNTMAANLNGGDATRTIGTSLLVHVMAGDKVAMNVSTYFTGYTSSQDSPLSSSAVMNQIITTLTGGVGGFGGGESHNTKVVQTVFTPANYSKYNDIINAATDPTLPKAYLNYVLFDEKMQIVTQMAGAFQATGNGNWTQIGTPSALEIPANGYLAVYLSNTSSNVRCSKCSDVYFDQLLVNISHGNLLEENHYYPHGLPIFGLGSKTADLTYKNNRNRYQNNEFITDQGLNWMSFGARQYDPQIGRFLSIDPLAIEQDGFSPYVAMGNQPESSIDPNGMQQFSQTYPMNKFNNRIYLSDFHPALNHDQLGGSDGGIGTDLSWMFSPGVVDFVWGDDYGDGKGSLDQQMAAKHEQEVQNMAMNQQLNGTGYYVNAHGDFARYIKGVGGTDDGRGQGTYEDYLKREKPMDYTPISNSRPYTPRQVMANGFITAGLIIGAGGGVEDVPADLVAAGRIGASIIEAMALWTAANYATSKEEPIPLHDNSAYKDKMHYTVPDPTNRPNQMKNVDPNNDFPEFKGVWKWISIGVAGYELYDNYKSGIPESSTITPVDGTYVAPTIQPSK
jgi:RHS repeat-associated protein